MNLRPLARGAPTAPYNAGVFPTTIWTTIQRAGDRDPQAMQGFAERYRLPVLRFIRRRGFGEDDAEDLCQEVFMRLLAGDALERADASKGRFRSLMLAIARNTILHRLRKRKEVLVEELEIEDTDPEFDREWIVHLTERAMARLREAESPYYDILAGHLGEEKQDRKKLWIARKKLRALIRDEVVQTCTSADQVEAELAYLERFLRPNSHKD